jgi:hypothetical protein
VKAEEKFFMLKEDYIKTIALMAAVQLAGRLRVPEYGSITEVAVRNSGEIFAEAVKLADRVFQEQTAKAEEDNNAGHISRRTASGA